MYFNKEKKCCVESFFKKIKWVCNPCTLGLHSDISVQILFICKSPPLQIVSY